MYYRIEHKTTYDYDVPVSESVMEVRSCPRSEGTQRCWSFGLRVEPQARVFEYLDALSNFVHHFDVPAPHRTLTITSEAEVDVQQPAPLPERLDVTAWEACAELIEDDDCWEMLQPSRFAVETPELLAFAAEVGLDHREDDPLTMLHRIRTTIAEQFAYQLQSTRVDSPIEVALETRRGVCQDFSHLMIALARRLGIPSRYVSGYLYHRSEDHDRSEPDATHAWVEACLPELGWIGMDPTNDLIVEDRHVRVAVGRDYADVPPTKGIYRGQANSKLSVSVTVRPAEAPRFHHPAIVTEWPQSSWFSGHGRGPSPQTSQQQQQQ